MRGTDAHGKYLERQVISIKKGSEAFDVMRYHAYMLGSVHHCSFKPEPKICSTRATFPALPPEEISLSVLVPIRISVCH